MSIIDRTPHFQRPRRWWTRTTCSHGSSTSCYHHRPSAATFNKLPLVLSFAAGNSGGVIRDLLVGAVPPAAISDWRYLAASLLAGVMTFFWYPNIARLRSPVLLFDGAGLALFCVAGAQKALAFGLNPLIASLLGMLTGIGGGMMRDVLLSEVPVVLRADFYAVATLAGATVVVAGDALGMSSTAAAFAGGVLCFCLRLIGIRRGWRLPTAHAAGESASESGAGKKQNDL